MPRQTCEKLTSKKNSTSIIEQTKCLNPLGFIQNVPNIQSIPENMEDYQALTCPAFTVDSNMASRFSAAAACWFGEVSQPQTQAYPKHYQYIQYYMYYRYVPKSQKITHILGPTNTNTILYVLSLKSTMNI